VQTQMSFIFLAGEYAYKVKKPVNLGYLDYTTLEKRRFFCRQEVELNRRLSPDVYIGVAPVVYSGRRICVGGQGETIEYAVKMRRLPGERMMDSLLISNQVSKDMVKEVAEKVAAFHDRAATSVEISAYGEPAAIAVNTGENFTQTEKYIDVSIAALKYGRIKAYTDGFVKSNEALFRRRVKGGRIRDCHGDLHAAHICFTNGIEIFDCIEFNDRFRYCDVASEVAFLAMDLDRYQRADLSQAFVDRYVQLSRDEDLPRLLDFYKCYRAYVRGKVACFKYDDPYVSPAEKDAALAAARGYFDLAYRYAKQRPLLLITAGLVGTGKTTVAQALGRSLGLVVISSDITRKRLAGIPPTEHRFEEFESGIYSEEYNRKTYDELLTRARELLEQGKSVILDASFKKRQHRLQANQLAGEARAGFAVVECVLDGDTIKRRLEQRLVEGGSASDGRWEILQSQRQAFDRIVEFPPEEHIAVHTSQPVKEIVKTVSERIWS